MSKQDPCCPAPSELRVFRVAPETGNLLSYTVPAGKVLIINAMVTGFSNTNHGGRMLRNSDVVAERVAWVAPAEVAQQVFPTGIAFLAGDTFTLEAYPSGPMYAYGYERDA